MFKAPKLPRDNPFLSVLTQEPAPGRMPRVRPNQPETRGPRVRPPVTRVPPRNPRVARPVVLRGRPDETAPVQPDQARPAVMRRPRAHRAAL